MRKRKWPWIARQVWDNLLFMHWPVPYEALRPYVPPPFEIETYDGQAWVSVVLFEANGNGPRGMPGQIPFSSFLELNVRTYVNFNDEPGVYFFSLDADSPVAVRGARTVFSLPYIKADMTFEKNKEWRYFESRRTHGGYPEARLSVKYRPLSEKRYYAERGSLTEWLVERYCLWTLKGNNIYKGPIYHTPWDLQEAEADWNMKELTDFTDPSAFKKEPLVQFCETKKVRFYPFEKYGVAETDFDELRNLKYRSLNR